jgi:exosortase E/protease (VPEID-CTERM system)
LTVSRHAVEQEPPPESLPTGRWLSAAALLIVEYIVAILLFDSERLPIAKDSSAFRLLGESMPVIIVVATATFLIGEVPSKAELSQIATAFRQHRRTWPLIVGHLAAYASALGITIFVFNTGREVLHPWLWVSLWAAAGACSLLLLIAALVPKAAFRTLARPAARALTAGLLVGLAALLAGFATSQLWEPMSRWTLELTTTLLSLWAPEVVSIPEKFIVGTPSYNVFIDRQCSGYEGIGLITVLLGFYFYYFRKSLRFPNVLVLLPIGVVLVWVSNSLRIAALISVGTWLSPEVAEGGFHSAAGWLLFCIITLALVAVSRKLPWFSTDHVRVASSLRTPESAYLLPLLVLLATAQVTMLFSAGFDPLYPLRVAAPLIPLWLYRSYYSNLTWSWSWTPIGVGILVFALWVALEPPPDPETADAIPDALAQMHWAAAGFWIVSRILGSTLVVPVVEELAFRGYLLRRLISSDFTAVSARQFTLGSFLISSVVFGMLHGRWLAGILAGMLYAAAQYQRGRLGDAIVAHATTNGLLAIYVLIFGHWFFL